MNSKRLYYVLLGCAIIMVGGLLGGAYFASGLLQGKAAKLSEARAKIQALDNQQTSLNKAKRDVEQYSELGSIAKSIVPQDKDQAQTVREIVKIASAAGVKLGSINFPTSTLGSKVPAASNTPTGGASGNPAPAAGAAPMSQLKAVPGLSGVYDLAITVQSDTASPATYDQFIRFLEGLESNRRTALVSGITITPDTKNLERIGFTLNINEYIKP